MFNKKNWSVQQEIQKRANLESEVEYWANFNRPSLPKFEKTTKVKYKGIVGWYIFTKDVLNELRP